MNAPITNKRGIASLFADRKIATKIGIGFACILVIMATISGLAYVEFGKVGKDFSLYTSKVNAGTTVSEIDRHFLAFRRHVGESSDNMEENFAAAEKTRAIVRERIAQALKTLNDPERRAKMQHLAEQFDIYSKDFDKVAPMRREQAKLTKDVLDPTGQKMRLELEALQSVAAAEGNSGGVVLAGEAIKLLMQMRLNAEKMLTRHDEVFVKAAEQAFENLKLVLATFEKAIVSEDARQQFDQVKSHTVEYHDAFVKAVHDSEEIYKLFNGEMRQVARAIAADAEAIKKSEDAEEQQIEHEVIDLIAFANTFILILALGGLVVGAVLAFLIGRAISVPTRAIGAVLVELANGNKTVEVPYADRGDEVGDNARAAKTFKENLLRIEQMEADQKQAEIDAAARRKADMHKMADDFQAAVGQIVDTVSSASTELEAAAGTLTSTAQSTQTLSSTVAAASEQASSNVQTVAAATEELTSSVDEISRQVQESARIAGEAVREAELTDARIAQLSQAAGRIGDVVKLITAIAEQTNLLALNATIEAARAGDAGRGFAVVASEVKALAAQTGKATEEISLQIAGMQTATEESVAAIKAIGSTITRISEISTTIASAVEEQGAATQEIARNVAEAARGTAQVATNITEVNRGAGETGSASSQVLSSAQSLSQESNHLKLEVDNFLSTVRAA